MTPEEKKLVEEVKEEIKKTGSIKEGHEQLKKSFEEFKAEVESKSNDYLSQEKLSKFATDITVRQEELDKLIDQKDKDVQERMNQLEVAMKRSPLTSEDKKQVAEDIKSFNASLAAIHGKKAVDVNEDSLLAYQKSFESYMRTKEEKFMSPDSLKALQVGSDADGGYTVTPAIAAQMIKRLFEIDPIRSLASVQTISTDALEIFADYDEPSVGWEGETENSSETDTPTFNKKRIPVHVLSAKPRATQTLLDDSAVNIESWLGMKIAEKFGRTEAAAFVSGNGVGKPRGFLTYANGTTFGTVERVALGAAAAITADGLMDLRYSLIEQYLDRASWLVNRTTLRDIMKLKDGNGEYLWSPGLRDNNRSTLLGLPVRMSTSMPTVAAGALSVALASWQDAYQIVDRMGITVQRDPYTAKPFVEFYTRKRVGGDVTNFSAIKLGVVSV